MVNIPASLQFAIFFTILIFGTQAASTFSTHSEGRGVEITEDSLPKLRDEEEESRRRRRRGEGEIREERSGRSPRYPLYINCEGGQDGGLGGHQLVGGGK